MKRSIIVVVVLCLCSVGSFGWADVISLRADPWCPYNCDPGDPHPGILIEIAKVMFERAGHQIDYQLLNWARAKLETQNGTVNGAVGMLKDDDTVQEYVFGDNELAIAQLCYFVRDGYAWQFQGVPSLETEVLGVINGYGYYTELDEYIERNKDTDKVEAVGGDDPLKPNINKLVRERISVVVEDKLVLEYTLKAMGLAGKVKSAGCVDFMDKIHIAFSKVNPKSLEYAKILSDGVEQLRQSGELKTILDAYGVKDWK